MRLNVTRIDSGISMKKSISQATNHVRVKRDALMGLKNSHSMFLKGSNTSL